MARIRVVLDDEVLEAIDDKMGQRGRSRFLEEAAREKLARIELEDASRKGAGLLKNEALPPLAEHRLCAGVGSRLTTLSAER